MPSLGIGVIRPLSAWWLSDGHSLSLMPKVTHPYLKACVSCHQKGHGHTL